MNPKPSNPRSTSWKPVLFSILVIPFAFSLVLTSWMGVPKEEYQAPRLFELLELSEVPLKEMHTLQYGALFFCRLRLEPQAVKPFYDQLEGVETSQGKAEPPIALKLEREWWDPGETEIGTYWRYGPVTLWSPDPHPDLVYAVVREGDVK